MPSQFEITNQSCEIIRKTYEGGLDPETVRDHTIIFGKNLTEVPKKPWYKLMVDEVLSPFYIFQVILKISS